MSAGLQLTRNALLSIDDLDMIEHGAARILETSGVRVIDDAVRAQLVSAGFAARGDRVLIESDTVRAFLSEERERNGSAFSAQPEPPPADEPIRLSTIQYPLQVHDLDTDAIVPFTTDRLIEAVKLVDVLHDRGVATSPPGTPSDAPPALQPVIQYWVAATYSRQGKRPIDAKAGESMTHVFEMADILGHPVRHLPVYVFSPLTLCGESLRCVLRYRDRLDGFGVSSMPSVGLTASINARHAFALAAAEVIGSAILVREIVNLPVNWYVNLFPIDLGSMAMVFGSPEGVLLELMGNEVTAFLKGHPRKAGTSAFHTNAKLPGAQSCSEKASAMSIGALLGGRYFGCGGSLSLDEIFSAEQLIYDLEIKDHVERLLRGFDSTCDVDDCVAEVAEALEHGSFAALDATSSEYRDVYWRPSLFERDFVNAWKQRGEPRARKRAHQMARDLVASHDYQLNDDLQQGIDGVLADAKRAFDGNSS